MSFFKIYVSQEEREEIEAAAKEEGVSVSTYVKNKLELESASAISQALAETIHRAENLPPCVFSIPGVFTQVEWEALTKTINPGQLGKQFYEQVEQGNVNGVCYEGTKNRKALYKKV